MPEDFFAALMMRRPLPTTTNIKTITDPGIYPVDAGNANAPGSLAGVLIVLLPKNAPKRKFIPVNTWNVYTLVNGDWQGLGSSAIVDVTKDAYDTTAGRVLKVGDYGLGATSGVKSLASIFDIKCGATYSALGLGAGADATVGMPGNSANTRFGVYAYSIYSNQYWVSLVSTAQVYTGMVNTSTKTVTWTQHYTDTYKPTAKDVGALPLVGGTLTADGAVITLLNSTTGKSNFLIAKDADNANKWYIGNGSNSNYDALFNNYKGGNNNIALRADGSISITAANSKNVNITGQAIPSNYGNFDARYQSKGSYYTTAQSDARYVQNVRVGAVGTFTINHDAWSEAPVGAFMTGWYFEGDNPGGDSVHYRPIQININGSWRTITA